MKAYWRDDLQEDGHYPACNIELTHDDWTYLDFDVIETQDGLAGHDEYNMIIRHPYTKQLLYVCSIDFNFKEQYK